MSIGLRLMSRGQKMRKGDVMEITDIVNAVETVFDQRLEKPKLLDGENMDAYLYRYAIYKSWKLTDRLLDELAEYFKLTVGDVVEAIELVEYNGVENHPYGKTLDCLVNETVRRVEQRRARI